MHNYICLMKFKFTLLYFLLFAISAGAQNITGIWKGYFVQSNFGFSEDRYRFEVQIAQLPNDAINGVTYSYKTTVFYGKAEAKGIYTTKTNNIILNELKLVDLKIADKSDPCLMTCYLEYDKMGEVETLTGTYSSRTLKNTDCGTGKIYLEKSLTSDFYKEDFVTKRENELKKKDKSASKNPTQNRLLAKKPAVKPGAEDNLIKKPLVSNKKPLVPNKKPGSQNKPTAKIAAPKKLLVKPKTDVPLAKHDNKAADNKPENKVVPAPETITIPKKEEVTKAPAPPVVKALPKPEVIRSRNNELVKTITTSSKEFKIDLYDNGEIDGDRISVYHNNELIVSNKMLTDKPISFNIKADENAPVHEFVMVAENLGSIPPNTSLMIITAGTKRYELFVTSTEQKNAVVRIEFKPE